MERFCRKTVCQCYDYRHKTERNPTSFWTNAENTESKPYCRYSEAFLEDMNRCPWPLKKGGE